MCRSFSTLTLSLLVLAAAGSCRTAPKLLVDGSMARAAGIQYKNLSARAVTVLFAVEVVNPYESALDVDEVEYELKSGGRPFASGEARSAGSIPALSTRTVQVPVELEFSELEDALDGVHPGSVIPFEAELGLQLRGRELLEVPVQTTGELPVPAVPEVAVKSIQWEELSLSRASALVQLHIWNRNQFPTELSRISYALALAGVPVVHSSLAEPVSLAPGAESDLELRASFSPQSLGLAFFSVLTGAGAGYELSGTMQLSSPFGEMTVPYRKSGKTPFQRTVPEPR